MVGGRVAGCFAEMELGLGPWETGTVRDVDGRKVVSQGAGSGGGGWSVSGGDSDCMVGGGVGLGACRGSQEEESEDVVW